MGEKQDTRDAYDKFRGKLRENGMSSKEADRRAREAAIRHDERREKSR
jgi:hypothetical protein